MSQSVHILPTSGQTSSAPQWHILGAGAMGCLWACRLLETLGPGSVQMIVRNQESLDEFQGYLTLEVDGRSTHYPVTATVAERLGPGAVGDDQHSADDSTMIKRLLLATKAHETSSALKGVWHAVTKDVPVVLLQNGIRTQLEMMSQYPDSNLYALSTSHGAWKRAPFHVVHAGHGEAWVGPLKQANQATPHVLRDSMPLPWQSMNMYPDKWIVERLWRKFAINCAINGLTAIHNCRNGELLSNTDYLSELHGLCAEISQLLVRIDRAPAVTDLYAAVEQVLTVTACNHSSTHQDIRHGRQTEIRELNGYLCDMATEQNLPCPCNQSVLNQVLALEKHVVKP
jgi:2-dehydropantoate 2-reductase